ncbi:MAG: hypothetical protein ACOVMM_08905, partial [Chitinophagaceae bacterium]
TIILMSCNNQSTKNEHTNTAIAPVNTCYLYALNNDSVILHLKDSNSIISGKLDYLPYEKDGTIGTLYDFKFMGDTLFGMYKSYQEGIETVGEMAMLKKGNTIILTNDNVGGENYKFDSLYTNGKFVNRSKITFTGDTLQLVNCK